MPKIKAIMVVHIYGRVCNMDLVHAFAEKHGLYVIEDLAEAHGVQPHPKTHAICHSFYRNKIVYGEEGGAVWFKNNEHAKLARQLRSLGFTDAHDFNHIPRGHNYRMSNAHASLVLDSLSRYRENLADRWRQMEQLDSACPAEWKLAPRSAPWIYDFRIPGLTKQDEIVTELNKVGITARHCFKPMHLQREFKDCRLVCNATGSEALTASQEVIYIALVPHRPRIDQIVFRRILEILVDKA